MTRRQEEGEGKRKEEETEEEEEKEEEGYLDDMMSGLEEEEEFVLQFPKSEEAVDKEKGKTREVDVVDGGESRGRKRVRSDISDEEDGSAVKRLRVELEEGSDEGVSRDDEKEWSGINNEGEKVEVKNKKTKKKKY
jgi:hypothetical protein